LLGQAIAPKANWSTNDNDSFLQTTVIVRPSLQDLELQPETGSNQGLWVPVPILETLQDAAIKLVISGRLRAHLHQRY